MPGDLTIGLSFGIGMTPAPRVVLEALTEAAVHSGTGGPSGFDLKFAAGTRSPLVGDLLPSGYFDPGTRVVITAVQGGAVDVLIDGVITQHEMAPSNEPGKSVLSVKGEDLTRLMDVVDLTGLSYPAMPAEACIALMIAKYSPLYGIVPLVVPSVLLDVPNPLELVPTQHGTDRDYIDYLASLVGYTFYLQPGPVPGASVAYWGPLLRAPIPFLPAPPPLCVNWDARTNVERLQFAFDGFGATQYVVLAQEPESHVPIPIPVPNINPISPPLATKMPAPLKIRQLSGLDRMSLLQKAAVALATAAAGANSATGSGSLNVVRYGTTLHARTLAEVRGAGITYDGEWFVESVTSTIKPGSFTQDFTLSRNSLVAAPPTAAGPAPAGLTPPLPVPPVPAGPFPAVPPGPSLPAPSAPLAGTQPSAAGRPARLPAGQGG